MVETYDAGAGFSLANKVIRKQISLDEGMVRAQLAGTLDIYINSLNSLAGREWIKLEDAKERLNRGHCQRALKGEDALLPLPPELDRSPESPETTSESVDEQAASKPPADEESAQLRDEARTELQAMDDKIRDLKERYQEVTKVLGFLESIQRSRTSPPKPWVGSAVLVALTLGAALLAFAVTQSKATIVAVLMAGFFFSALLFQREYNWYARLMRIEKSEAEHRVVNIAIQRRQMGDIQAEIQDLRKEGKKKFQHLRQLEEGGETTNEIEFSRIFARGRSRVILDDEPLDIP